MLRVLCLFLGLLWIGLLQVEASPNSDNILLVYSASYTGDEDNDGIQDSLQVQLLPLLVVKSKAYIENRLHCTTS